MEARILHVDNHLLVVAKPPCVPSVPDSSGDPSCLDGARAWVGKHFGKPGRVYLGVVHRLDRPVSGTLLFARTSKAASRLSAAFREGRVGKTYWGIAERQPASPGGTIERWLRKDRERNRVAAFEREVPGGRLAVTGHRLLARLEEGRALLELRPQTGRPHQLRVAAACLGAPLLGDLKYGASAPLPDKSIALHALSLELDHPVREERLRFTCAPPVTWPWSALPVRAPAEGAKLLGGPGEDASGERGSGAARALPSRDRRAGGDPRR